MMPADGLDRVRGHDAIFLGAVGAPGVSDHESLWGLLIPIRRGFRQYVNLRPIRLFEGVPGPLAGARPADIDLVVVRENSEGEYSEIGGRHNRGHGRGAGRAGDGVHPRRGDPDRRLRLRPGRAPRAAGLTSATKSNGIVHTMPFWDEIVAERAAEHPGVTLGSEHIDALCAKLVLDPGRFDVIVASNLFGDILSDLAAAVAGSIGMAPSANIDPTREFPSMFEPVHGSAPDIAGRGVANPIGAIWTAALMLEHLGHAEAAAEVVDAIAAVLARGDVRTADLGGTPTTDRAHRGAIIDALGATS